MNIVYKSLLLILSVATVGIISTSLFPINESKVSNTLGQRLLERENTFYTELSFLYDSGRVDEIDKLITSYSSDSGDIENDIFVRPKSELEMAKNSSILKIIEERNCLSLGDLWTCNYDALMEKDTLIEGKWNEYVGTSYEDSSIYSFQNLDKEFSKNLALSLDFVAKDGSSVEGAFILTGVNGEHESGILGSRFIQDLNAESGRILFSNSFTPDFEVKDLLFIINKKTDAKAKVVTLNKTPVKLTILDKGHFEINITADRLGESVSTKMLVTNSELGVCSFLI